MKKHLYLLFITFFGIMPFVFTSCSDDDESNDGNGSSVGSVIYCNSEKLNAVEATISMSNIDGNYHFYATLKSEAEDEFSVDIHEFSFFTKDAELTKGLDMNIGERIYHSGPGSTGASSLYYESGTAIIKSIDGDKVTVEFNNFKWYDKTLNNATRTISGEITYTKE